MKCPKCGYQIPAKKIARALGAKGGKTTGSAKARTSEQARAAALAGVAKRAKCR